MHKYKKLCDSEQYFYNFVCILMNNENLKTIAISGANGFIGNYLCDYFKDKSYNVIAYIRNEEKSLQKKGIINITFDLKNTDSIKISNNIDYFIHCAYIRKDKNNYNFNAVKTIKKECAKNNVKFIFLSSMSAKEDALSNYGLNKFRIERFLNKETDLILRLGLVIGNGGLYKSLSLLFKRNRFIPLIGKGNQQIQTVGIEQLSKITNLLISKNKTGIYTIAEKEAVFMKDFYKELSKSIGSKNIFIPIPYFVSDLAFTIIDFLKINIGVDKENYLGLKTMKKENTNIEEELDIDVLDYKNSIYLASS